MIYTDPKLRSTGGAVINKQACSFIIPPDTAMILEGEALKKLRKRNMDLTKLVNKMSLRIQKLKDCETLLKDIHEDLGGKINKACPVCGTYSHKHWCWYPQLLKCLGYKMDKYDRAFLKQNKEEVQSCTN